MCKFHGQKYHSTSIYPLGGQETNQKHGIRAKLPSLTIGLVQKSPIFLLIEKVFQQSSFQTNQHANNIHNI
jgi:hypothetical protein